MQGKEDDETEIDDHSENKIHTQESQNQIQPRLRARVSKKPERLDTS